jgi:HPt (histidine-containing phosphotransfer) domain-containing protein
LRAEMDRLTQSQILNEGERMTTAMNRSTASMLNLPELLSRIDNDRELLCELLSIFKQEFPACVKSLKSAMVCENVAEIANFSHTLKGMLSNLALPTASASAARLEQLARAGETGSLHDAFAAFQRDVHGLLPEVETYMAEARP